MRCMMTYALTYGFRKTHKYTQHLNKKQNIQQHTAMKLYIYIYTKCNAPVRNLGPVAKGPSFFQPLKVENNPGICFEMS